MVAQLEELERLRNQTTAAQLRLAYDLRAARRQERIIAGQPPERWEAGVPREIGLALGVSPNRAGSLLSVAKALREMLPHALARLTEGSLSLEKVTVISTGLSHLEPGDQGAADRELCADPEALIGVGIKRLRDKVREIAYRLDPRGTLARAAKAAKDRRVSIRPEPDCMARVSLLLPVVQAVGVYAALRAAADRCAGVGTEVRSKAQIMADLAFARITGRESVAGQPVAVTLTISDRVLLGGHAGTAHLTDGGIIPGEIARGIIGKAAGAGLAWVRRLYIRPAEGAVVGMDSRARCFPKGLADLIGARDRYCRTPYCDAPIAHNDHVDGHAAGGATTLANGQGLCVACNHAKEALGWAHRVVPDRSGRHTVETVTPAGRSYRSTAPPQR